MISRLGQLGNVGYRPDVLHKEFPEYHENFWVVGTFEPAGEFQTAGDQEVGHAEEVFAEQDPSVSTAGINGGG